MTARAMDKTKRKRRRQVDLAGPSKRSNIDPESLQEEAAYVDNVPQPDEIGVVGKGAANYGGNYYEHLAATDNARVHNGAIIQVNNIHGEVQRIRLRLSNRLIVP